MISSIKNLLKKKYARAEKPVAEAYDLWSGSYDQQAGNLVLDLDENIFTDLLSSINLLHKIVADIGCGTGRHWQKLYQKNPSLIMGFDFSAGMLHKLKQKFPGAYAQQITNNCLAMLDDASVDCIVTTLTIAHIKNIEEAIAAWARILKPNGDLIITDFHPAVLARGGRRSFNHNGKHFSVINYVHPLQKVRNIFIEHYLNIVIETEQYIDEQVRHYYEAQNALLVYDRFKGVPVIYGMHLKKQHGAE